MDTISINLHNHNKHCYSAEIISFDSGLFDDCIDMAYLITMENSKRRDAYMKQLSEHKPSSKVTIALNKGFRSEQCNKKLNKQESVYDITDALRNVFVNALENKYKRILVFEDDFFMDHTKYTKKDIERVVKFCNKKNPHVYNLGPFSCTGNIIDVLRDKVNYHYLCKKSSAAHGVIYNDVYMSDFVKEASDGKIIHCDRFWDLPKYKVYTYHTPLCFQLFPETENKKQWGSNSSKFSQFISNLPIKALKLDKSHENFKSWRNVTRYKDGWFITYTLFIIIIIVIVIIICIKNKKKS